jgi:hypothetical protein
MAILFKAYKDADGVIVHLREGGEEELRAAADANMIRVVGADKVTSNDENTNETPIDASFVQNLASTASAAAPVQDVAGKTGNVVLDKNDVGLSNVDNTSDINKPVSTAQQTALNAKYDVSNPAGYQTAAQVAAAVDAVIDAAPGTLDTLNELAAALGDDPNFATTVTNQINAVQANVTANDSDIAQNASDIAQNSSDIAQEITDRTNADSNLQSQITSNDADNAQNASDIAQEITDRTNADAALQSQITANDADIAQNASDIAQEITDRTNADTALQSQITSNDNDIAQEVTNRTNADAALQSQITSNDSDIAQNISNIAQNASDIAQEITDRTNADTNLQSQITSNDGDISTNAANIASNDTDIAQNASDIAQEITDRTNADSALQAQITSNDGDISTIQSEQTTQNNAIALNTAKVSADGPISTHSDVNTAGAIVGDLFGFNGSNWGPVSILNGFTIFPIWAEENGGLTNGNTQYSYGNGAVGVIGIVIPFDCEIFAVTFDAETFGTSVSVDTRLNGSTVNTSNFTAAQQFQNITAVPVTAGQRISFATNTVVGAANDVRVCAWLRVRATAAFPTPDRQKATNNGVAFSATSWQDIPGMSVTVSLSDNGTIDGTVNYSAARSGGINAEAEFRVVINGNAGFSFPDTLSTFNDNGSSAHSLDLPAGTYTVTAQCQTTQPINIAAIVLTAVAVED